MIGYSSISEAEGCLGRKLSVAERVWYNYSANKPDYILHYHNLVFFFIVYTIAPLPYLFIHLNHLGLKYKIQPCLHTSFSTIFKCYCTVIKTFLLAVVPLQIASYPTIKMVGIRTGLALDPAWEMLLQIVVYVVVEDYGHYWLHRLLHSKWGYDNIHRVHHEFTAPMAVAAPYAHWAEVLLLGLPSFLGPALVPGHITTYWLWFIFRNLEAIDTHSGYDLTWSPTKYIPFYGGSEYHDYHHYVGSQSRSNFASVFTYCDYVYGTDKGYRYRKFIANKMKGQPEQFGERKQARKIEHEQ